MGVINRAIRNISRRKIRALLVIIALGFSMAIMISIPAGVLANQQTATNMASPHCGSNIKLNDETCPICKKPILTAVEEPFSA